MGKTFAEQCEEIMARPPEIKVLCIKQLSKTTPKIQQLAKELYPKDSHDVAGVVNLEINDEKRILFLKKIKRRGDYW